MSLKAYHAAVTGVAETIRQIEVDTGAKVLLLLDEIGQLTVEYLQSITSERRPPVYPDQSFRYAHPGHWADRSGDLAAAYRYEVDGQRFRLTIINDDPGGYGAILEARVGFFVVTGVTNAGGPVEKAMQRAIQIVAPDWSFTGFSDATAA